MEAGVPESERQQLERRLVGWETAEGLDDLAKRTMQQLDAWVVEITCGYPARRRRTAPRASSQPLRQILPIAGQRLPHSASNSASLSVAASALSARQTGLVDGMNDRLAVLPGHDRPAVLDQVDDAGFLPITLRSFNSANPTMVAR